ncbi:hypothetical protein BKA66DRAFT_474847 [Pyrenochaeta sp. MPI-SDFR-AT-0127]|nr:hypothetical protein BKA66DRAFT_474847 [Pyrenochaeta sp. MPI-SDFR-AT-0127]
MSRPIRDSLLEATPYNIRFSATSPRGFAHVNELAEESADKASKLLMLNHAKYHTLFNEVGLHNHIVHHLCSIFDLGASPSELEAAYNLNKNYQLPQYGHDVDVTRKLSDAAFFSSCLGNTERYINYLHFFQDEIARRGVADVVREYVFMGDERADDILGRMYSGFEHPILHLGFAIEFSQPCLVAESLASACVHDTWPLDDFLAIEKFISLNVHTPRKSMFEVLEALRSDPRIAAAAKRGNAPNRVTDALLKHAALVIVPILAQWRVNPTMEDIKYRMAEMTNICAFLSGAAQSPKKQVSIDFFMMHSTNLSVFYPVFMQLDWLSLEQRARLLTWKGWMDLIMYAACGCPELYYNRIAYYRPKVPGPWSDIIARATMYPDDGHTAKLIRALINAERVSGPYIASSSPSFPLRKDDFLQIAHMAMDSVERMLEPEYKLPETTEKFYIEKLGMDIEAVKIVCRFVRWCGVEGAWEDVPGLEEEEKARL